jgi:hypothetical protein
LLREQYNRIHNRPDASVRDSGEDLGKRRKPAGKCQKPLQVEQDRIASRGTQQNVTLEEEEEKKKKKLCRRCRCRRRRRHYPNILAVYIEKF